jgi:hypothetical protein
VRAERAMSRKFARRLSGAHRRLCHRNAAASCSCAVFVSDLEGIRFYRAEAEGAIDSPEALGLESGRCPHPARAQIN